MSDTQVLNGQYWSSPHFTKEYILYLEMIGPWVKDFPTTNGLSRAEGKVSIEKDAPAWFTPPDSYEVWVGTQGSLYFIDPGTDHMYMYEVQL